MVRLGVNIDHVATLRQARGGREPEPVAAAIEAELSGADIITLHVREDHRHVSERDLRLLAHAALLPTTRALALFVDRRFARGRKPLLSVAWRCPRLYRPTRKEIEPRMIDNLYSELMNLRW